MPLLFLLFFAVPLVEIYFLIQVGGHIGAMPTVALVVFTAVVGVVLLRIQGFATLQRVRNQLAAGQLPALEMVEGVVLVVAGALLLTPGFFTDAIGFLCLVPPLRRGVIMLLFREGMVRVMGKGAARTRGRKENDVQGEVSSRSQTYEGEYRREDE